MNKFGTTTAKRNLSVAVEQPGATFSTRRGGFDQGTRTFMVDAAYLGKAVPAKGTRDRVYRNMFVDEAEVEFMTADLCRVSVRYLGMITGGFSKTAKKGTVFLKPPEFTVSTNLTQFSDVPEVQGITAVSPVRWTRSLPTVTVEYITGIPPSQAEVGSHKPPPRFADTPRPFYANTWRPGFVKIFEGWILSNRTARTAGPMYEVMDVYNYVVHEIKPES